MIIVKEKKPKDITMKGIMTGIHKREIKLRIFKSIYKEIKTV